MSQLNYTSDYKDSSTVTRSKNGENIQIQLTKEIVIKDIDT